MLTRMRKFKEGSLESQLEFEKFENTEILKIFSLTTLKAVEWFNQD